MQAGSLITSDVMEYPSRVLVNGVERPHVSWSVDRELNGDLPAQVVSVNGITQATGSIQWAGAEDVTERGTNPWNRSTGWIPSRGDRVEIYVGDGVTEWKKFHGVVDKTTGTITEGFQSTLIDDYDKLSGTFNHPAMLRIMPPLAWDGSEPYRSAGLHPLYYVDRMLREAGFHCTPPREANTALFVPMQGSRWPHFGSLESSTGWFNTVAPWGLGACDGQAAYTPGTANGMSSRTQISMLVAPDHASPVDVFVDYGSTTHHLRLTVDGSRTAIAMKNGAEVCRLALGAATVISMLARDGTIRLATNSGGSASGTFSPSGSPMSKIRINAGASANIAGLQVSRPSLISHEHASTLWTPTAKLDTSSLYLTGIMDAAPCFEGRNRTELLGEINDAVLSAMWIDETGVMRWVSSDALRDREPVKTVTTLDDVLSLDWEDGLLSTVSKVTVKGRKPGITTGRWRNLVVARGDKQSIKSNDELVLFMEPESDEDWINPAFDTIEVGGAGNIWGSYNNPAYSAVGLYYTTDGGETTVPGLSCTITTQELGYQKLMVKYVAGTWPSDVEGVLATHPTSTVLWPKNRNNDLPRLVGRGRIKWADEEVTATGAGGPGPELTHDAGVWANRTDSTEMLERYASYIQSQTATPKPVITGLSIVPDPRLQLGDVITIDSPDLMGVNLTALIVGVSESHDGALSQSLTVRVIDATSTYQSYTDYNDALTASTLTYQQWQLLGPIPQTYEQFNDSQTP